MYRVLCKVYSVQCTVYTLHCTLIYTLYSTVNLLLYCFRHTSFASSGVVYAMVYRVHYTFIQIVYTIKLSLCCLKCLLFRSTLLCQMQTCKKAFFLHKHGLSQKYLTSKSVYITTNLIYDKTA